MQLIINSIKTVYLIIWTLFISTLSLIAAPFDWKKKFHSFVMRLWAQHFMQIAGIKLSIEGKENLEEASPAVIIINHESAIDIPVVIAALPVQERFLAKLILFQMPIFGWALFFGGHIPVNRSKPKKAIASINKRSGKIVARKQNFVISPEGTRSIDGRIQKFKKGAFKIADQYDLPIIPVVMMGNRHCAPKGSKFVNPGHIKVKILQKVDLNDYTGIRDCMEEVRKRMADYKHEYEDKRA